MKYFWIILGLVVLIALVYFLSRSNYGTMSNQNVASTPTPAVSETGVPEGNISVSIDNFAFSPATLTVPALTEVTFSNNDSVTHDVTADDGSFDSGRLNPGKTFTHVFEKPGTFSYHCSIHTTMKGKVVVE